jgi:hypothetical protein
MRMTKKPLNLLIDEELVQKARDHGLVISKFLENQLRGYFNFIEGRHNNYSQSDNINNESSNSNKSKMGLSEFESESLAPKAKRIDQATPQAQNIFLVT